MREQEEREGSGQRPTSFFPGIIFVSRVPISPHFCDFPADTSTLRSCKEVRLGCHSPVYTSSISLASSASKVWMIWPTGAHRAPQGPHKGPQGPGCPCSRVSSPNTHVLLSIFRSPYLALSRLFPHVEVASPVPEGHRQIGLGEREGIPLF